MSATTQCPTCLTRFKVSDEQLEAHQGLVRCGRCQAVFNATESLQDDKPTPQMALPIEPEAALPDETSAPHAASDPEHEPSLAEEARYEWHDPELPAADEVPAVSLAQAIRVEEIPPSLATQSGTRPQWPWMVGSAFMILMLLAQAAYFFRVEIAAKQPGLKPALLAYCRLLGCSVPLPQKVELMSIESSFLEADPVQSGVITLNALLRNHAPYPQAYPMMELTLTDAEDKPLARRIFRPGEYLKPDAHEESGLMSNRELGIKLNLDTADLKPSGYRLLLYYQ